MRILYILLFTQIFQFAFAQSPVYPDFQSAKSGVLAVPNQSFLSIVDPANAWTVDHFEFFLTSRRTYRFSSDSVLINGFYCHELEFEDSFMGSQSTDRFYREENGLVYRSNGELVYNLNLLPGDTLPSNLSANQGTRTVIASGTLVYNDNLSRKFQIIQCAGDSSSSVTVVEGIGDLENFFFSEVLCINPLDGPTDLLVCYAVDGQTVYLKQGSNCDLSSSNEIDKNNTARVYPNPVVDDLHLVLPKNDIDSRGGDIRIYNALGICVFEQKKVLVEGEVVLNVSLLPTGIYKGFLQNESGRVYSFGFVK
ncbi:MAG: T9SS type A sorting domain-containing protein [Saprospiraceae bacterium]